MCSIRVLSGFALIVTLGPSGVVRAIDDGAGQDEPVVSVELKTIDSLPRLYGELRLGEVRAGATIETVFQISNRSDRAVEFAVVERSCSCARISVRSGGLAAGGQLLRPARLVLDIPKVMGRGAYLATFSLLPDVGGAPVVTIRIFGDVARPFWLPRARVSSYVGESSEFECHIPVELGPQIDPNDLRVRLPESVTADFSVSVVSVGARQGTIILKGARKAALRNRGVAFQLEYSQNGWSLSDAVSVDFYNSAELRIIPSRLTVEERRCAFAVYRKAGLDPERLVFLDAASDAPLAAELVAKSRTLVRVSLDFRDSRVPQSVVIADGDSRVSIPLLSDEDLDHASP